jgi:hypothetical protein
MLSGWVEATRHSARKFARAHVSPYWQGLSPTLWNMYPLDIHPTFSKSGRKIRRKYGPYGLKPLGAIHIKIWCLSAVLRRQLLKFTDISRVSSVTKSEFKKNYWYKCFFLSIHPNQSCPAFFMKQDYEIDKTFWNVDQILEFTLPKRVRFWFLPWVLS